jgi:multiple sugar transport system substrate-binding protein
MTASSPSPLSGVSRRSLLKGLGVGVAGVASAPILAACTGGSSSSSGGGKSDSSSKSATFGSSASDDVPKRAIAAAVQAFQTKSGDKISINTVAHNDFQERINSYLNGSPDDAFTWFAGYRMRYYAGKGLVAPVDDVWDKIGSNFSQAIADASTGDDGKKYFVPNYNYPWAIFYRKSVFAAKGYQVPKTFDELKTLCGSTTSSSGRCC